MTQPPASVPAPSMTVAARDGARVFWLFFWLAVVCVRAKFHTRGWPWGPVWSRLWELAILAHADVLFAIGAGLLVRAGLRLAGTRTLVRRGLWAGTVLFCVACVMWAVASVPAFRFLRSPITWPLVDLLGGVAALPQLAARFWHLSSGLISTTAGYLVLAWACCRWLSWSSTRPARIACAALLALLVCTGGVLRWYTATRWRTTQDNRRFADSPHLAMLWSIGRDLCGAGSARTGGRFDARHVHDFRVIADAPHEGLPTPSLKRGVRNVIFIVLESVSTRYVSLYGAKYDSTPNLVREAANALVFDRFHVPVANSGNSLFSAVLCRYPAVSWHEWIWDWPRTPGTSLPEVLRAAGRRTAFISSCNFSYCNGLKFLADRGFDVVMHWTDHGCSEGTEWWGVDDAVMIDSTLRWIDQDPSRPFYVMCWNQQTHHPFDPVKGMEQIDFFAGVDVKDRPGDWWDLNRFLNALRHNDRHIARLFDELRRRRLADDTLVIIIGDHGEAFGEPHNTYGHSGMVYEEDVRVPCIFWNPALFSGAGRSHVTGRLIDIGPSILDLLGIPAPGDWQGRSVFSPYRPQRLHFWGSRQHYLLGVLEGHLKYIWNVTDDRQELYDLSTDPDEQRNIAAAHPADIRRFHESLSAFLQYQMRLHQQYRGRSR